MYNYEPDTNSEYYMELEKRMYQSQQDCLEALASIVHPKYLEKFASILSYSYQEGHGDALNIADELKLNESHFFALAERKKDFEQYLIAESEENYIYSLDF